MKCAKCEAEFSCGADEGAEKCWCFSLPVVRSIPKEYESCLCPKCLEEFAAAEAKER